MSFLFVFFPGHNNNDSPSPSTATATTLFRSRSSRLLLSKAQSTISICILLLLLTLFLFTLSTFEPSSSVFPTVSPRRFLLSRDVAGARRPLNHRFALQGMGALFMRGTKSMHDLIVAHIASDTTERDLRLFVRLLHRSGATSRSDVVLLFSNNSQRFNRLIEEENNSFSKLVNLYRNSNQTDSVWSRFTRNQSKKDASEPIWGKKTHRANNNETESNELTHGSVVGFDVAELDPENSLSGFMDHDVPIALRRWACYPMLLGRVRRDFKHVMLVNAKTSLFLGDPFTRVRNRSPESVLFFKHGNNKINPAVIIGGAKGIRRLSSAMHTEIARATMQQQQRKRKSSVSESGVLSQLVGNVHMTKGFEVVGPSEVIAEASSLAELRTRNSAAALSLNKSNDIVQRGNSNHLDITATIMKRVCSSELDAYVYSYC
ncbi:uncharacterized protein LOC130510468 [Raphanus sativus]|uniref:Uncharacterized protein LOC130510468 n=1 Tax=Raphanus sativus TaxID=3726 RepID=A0A9W3DFT8_RAPSA|nr:uncharacterized protein LOC130510468 [Raphanus sativus]